jgi:hypothetical protein
MIAGCRPAPSISTNPANVSLATRNNCYSLLYQLLDAQKDVSILRFIKPEQADVKALVIRIAKTSGAGAAQLKQLAAEDASISLNNLELPPGEVSTRDAIASTTKNALLGETGEEFELTLLLTQTEALKYAWHLADVAAKNEPQPERARTLMSLGAEMEGLYQEVFHLMLAKIKQAPAPKPSPAHVAR